MPYIGKQPTVGNFQVCDAISVVNGQAAYTMQVNSTNVEPETANHMLVSLNGVLQKPGSSFTISGSTITFASNLATGDVIDFIILLGDVLNIGAPSDDAVATASIQANAVTAAKLNNDIISGLTALTSAPDDTDEFLISDAGTIKRIDASLVVGGGKVLQVVSSTGTAGFDTNSGSYVQVTGTGHGVAITPSATSSKVFIIIMFEARSSSVSNFSINTILRDSTDLSGGTRFAQIYGSANDFPVTMSFLDSPNTTSEVTYRIGTRSNSSSHNSRINASNQTFSYVAMEIGA